MNYKINRPAYQTPILWRDLKAKIIENISKSELMACEVEAILKDIYLQIQASAEAELQMAFNQKKAAEENEESEK